MAPTLAALEARFNSLSINSVVFQALSALFGVYVVLFILAMWTTYTRQTAASKGLRIVTLSLFVVLLIHYISRAVATGRSRLMAPAPDEQARFTVPLQFVTTTTKTISGFILDALLAWRCYVIYERRTWALWLPCTAVTANFVLGLIGDFMNFIFYTHPESYNTKWNALSFNISAIWGWCIFATNTILTMAIIGKILYVSRSSRNVKHYRVVLEAIVESAAVTWVGLLFYEIAATAPTHGHITNVMNIGFVLVCILPLFFGISQCLITVRLGLADDGPRMPVPLSSGTNSIPSTVDSAPVEYRYQAHEIAVTMTSESYVDGSKQGPFSEKAAGELAERV
ncbi:hypothetical protein BC629DRAFT_369049 [Irpex lacteus]|nr:hypothetical protein BC629DRAFT_369049 [Irpex lacteus]